MTRADSVVRIIVCAQELAVLKPCYYRNLLELGVRNSLPPQGPSSNVRGHEQHL